MAEAEKKPKKGKKIALIIIGIIVLIPVTAGLVFFKDIRTLMSVKKLDKGIYRMDCVYDYKLDGLLTANVASYDELLEWADAELFWGLPSKFSAMGPFGCASFSAVTEDGHHIFARNYDLSETDCLLIYTHPSDGYASMGFADLGFMGLAGKNASISPDDIYGKIVMRLAPYITCDGINEAGLGVSILMLDYNELHQDRGRDDILVTAALRAVLDRCATVDEAIEFLKGYDVHMAIGRNFHLFITDRTGRSVVAEWYDGELVITDTAACTNYYLCSVDFEQKTYGDKRYEKLAEVLNGCGGVMTRKEAMDLLSDVKQYYYDSQTEWSAVYDLEDFSVTVCFDSIYHKAYSFDRSSF